MKRTGSTTSIVVATIAGLAVLGIAGYRMMAGDCSSCALTDTDTTAVQPVAAEGQGGCCPLTDAAGTQAVATEAGTCADKAGECGSTCADQAAVQAVATEATGDDCADACGDACAGDACGTDPEACCGKCEKGQELAKAPK
ncbi:MAG: hypothetical protein KatS3mg103_0800 [Phycisphaerales bacterium]|nr:MAG: hypothetical protein KatS3mg103_0800 [Phycisphaerales bacterium]